MASGHYRKQKNANVYYDGHHHRHLLSSSPPKLFLIKTSMANHDGGHLSPPSFSKQKLVACFVVSLFIYHFITIYVCKCNVSQSKAKSIPKPLIEGQASFFRDHAKNGGGEW